MVLQPAFLTAFVVLEGLLVGSFLNVCIHRLPLKQSIITPRSRCPGCGTPLAWSDNIPVFSYAFLRGRCRTCHAPISIRYPIVELLTAGLFYWHWIVFGPTPLFVVRLVFGCALLVLFAIDLEHQILPDVITLPGIVLGFASSIFLPPGPLLSGVGLLVGGGLLWAIAEIWFRLRKVDAMGFGDVKMLAMVGAFLGAPLVLVTFVLATISGGLLGIVLMATKRATMASAIPFGTLLAMAALVASLYGDPLLAWYLSRF